VSVVAFTAAILRPCDLAQQSPQPRRSGAKSDCCDGQLAVPNNTEIGAGHNHNDTSQVAFVF
jgi:hypothetical protein